MKYNEIGTDLKKYFHRFRFFSEIFENPLDLGVFCASCRRRGGEDTEAGEAEGRGACDARRRTRRGRAEAREGAGDTPG